MISLRRCLLILGILFIAVWLGAQEPSGRAAGEGRAPAAASQAAKPQPAEAHKAQPGAEAQLAEASSEASHEEPMKFFGKVIPGVVVEALRWANFVVLFGALGWLLRKPLRRFFAARTSQIRQAIEAGRRALEEAAARLKEVEARLRNLGAEVEDLKRAAEDALRTERARLLKNAESEAARIRAQAEQEMEALIKAAQAEVKEYAAALAVDLAEKRIRARLTPARQAALVRDYAVAVAGLH